MCEGFPAQSSVEGGMIAASQPTVAVLSRLQSTTCLTARPTPALSCRQYGDHTQSRLALLATTALQCGESSRSGCCSPILSLVLPRLSCSIPMVTSSLAALGAALESTTLLSASPVATHLTALRENINAIRLIQDQLPQQGYSHEALILSCLILAFAEVVNWRETDGLKHFLGALELYRRKHATDLILSTRHPPSDHVMKSGDCETEVFIPRDELDVLIVQLDIQTATYALGLSPQLPAIDLRHLLSLSGSERQQSDLELESIRAIHSCYRGAFLMSRYKYTMHDCVPMSVKFEQARYIAETTACSRGLSRTIQARQCATKDFASPGLSLRQALILRCQCLASIIYLSMTSNSYECGYDVHADLFQQIVADSEMLLHSTRDRHDPIEQFSVSPGILQPLFLTAIKWRNPDSRRHAIALLSSFGREGPFHGRLLAAIAIRAVEVEEKGAGSEPMGNFDAADVAETSRLHGVGMITKDVGGENEIRAEITLSRCRDVDCMLNAGTTWDDGKHWDTWTESVYI